MEKCMKPEHSNEYRRAYWSGLCGLVVVGVYLTVCVALLAVAVLKG